jgi:phosphatidylglycerophosphatase A
MATRLALLICTVGGVGYSPVAPGTAGSVAGLAFYGVFRAFHVTPAIEALILVALVGAGAWSGTVAERHFGTTDPGAGVIDEVAGMLLTLYLLPATWTLAILGFVVFRTLDIIKPFPARRLESLPGGWGMMADDLMAAVYANLVLRGALALAPALLLR